MIIVGIDPGNIHSAYAAYDEATHTVLEADKVENGQLLDYLNVQQDSQTLFAIEMIASYGMPVGATVFDTCVWIGRFYETIIGAQMMAPALVYRKDVKMYLCHTMRAKDSNIRQAIIDRFPATGGGKVPQIGTKKEKGPLFGIRSDIWAAIGVALTYSNKIKDLQKAPSP